MGLFDKKKKGQDVVENTAEGIKLEDADVTASVNNNRRFSVIVDGVTIDTITIGDKDLEFIVTKPGVDPQHNITVIYRLSYNMTLLHTKCRCKVKHDHTAF